MRKFDLIEGYSIGINAIINFLGFFGGWIVNNPNGIFYILLFLGCLFLPYFALMVIISILCWSWSGGYSGQRNN